MSSPPSENRGNSNFLCDIVADARDVFDAHVLPKISRGDLASLACVNREMRNGVVATEGGLRDLEELRHELHRVENFVGSVSAMKWSKERGCPWDERTFACIAKRGCVDVMRWAIDNGCPWGPQVCADAAERGDAATLSWLLENGAPMNTSVRDVAMQRKAFAAACAHIAVGRDAESASEWLRKGFIHHYEDVSVRRTIALAAKGGHLTVLKLLRENGATFDEWSCSSAAAAGQLDALKWLRANGAVFDFEWTRASAARHGHAKVLDWLQREEEGNQLTKRRKMKKPDKRDDLCYFMDACFKR